MSDLWLPEGVHYDLHIEHRQLASAGAFTGGGNKWVWHTTESPWESVDSMFNVLRDKSAAPHFVIGGRKGIERPVVIQMLPLNEAGRALAHPFGPETNRADCIQTEICWRAGVSDQLELWHYKAFANLVRLANITAADSREVQPVLARRFNNPKRFGGQEFVDAKGHCGHMHVPGNDHTDPGSGFKGSVLMGLLTGTPGGGKGFPKGGYKL
jgi:hypothetical protein